MLIAPAVHKRIVAYTEHRLKATMPLSPQEIRAQKDMVRALYAAQNARTLHDLTVEREKATALTLQSDAVGQEAAKLLSETRELKSQIEDMSTEAADLRSRLRRAEIDTITASETIKRLEMAVTEKDIELEARVSRIGRLVNDIDHMRIEASNRETEIESLKSRLLTIRDEREDLRREQKLLAKRAKDAEFRLAQEEHKVLRLEDHIARDAAERADLASALERRQRELTDLKVRLKKSAAELRQSQRALRDANIALPDLKEVAMDDDRKDIPQLDTSELEASVRSRQASLTERLMSTTSSANDAALRDALGDIGARMVTLTALREGSKSPIPSLLAAPKRHSTSTISLVDRVVQLEPRLLRAQDDLPTAAE
ncbi:hypothetical protein FAA97_15505 [Peteryoungia ipomoeae]|uniref:Uncharacterized protein n=2 Tax=Peteryoungia ipomoeae TaxID=1210932 RepID=A0A4S8NZ31_9HYPH|nr:hypothetical protein FAA97_15505 [Peteryoungia ipomoeae]